MALTPSGAEELVAAGHQLLLEAGAGEGTHFEDDDYAAAGATLVSREQAWGEAEMVVKVKEPIAEEYRYLRSDLTLFCFLHLAAERALTEALVEAGTRAIAFETVESEDGRLPLLAPMSAIAGRLATQAAARFLEAPAGGRGELLGPVPGVAPAHVVVVGAGNVGYHAASVALGLGARVTMFDLSLDRLAHLEEVMGGRITLQVSEQREVEAAIADAEAVIGAVLVPGAEAPKVIRRSAVERMKPGAVICDVAIDQGGCAETSRPTTHADPTFVVSDVVHYCVSNMPGAVPRTGTRALSPTLLPYVLALAAEGPEAALARRADLARGLNAEGGRVVHAGVAAAHGLPIEEPRALAAH